MLHKDPPFEVNVIIQECKLFVALHMHHAHTAEIGEPIVASWIQIATSLVNENPNGCFSPNQKLLQW